MELSRDVRITMMTFAVMCMAAAGNLFFFQGKRTPHTPYVAPVERVAPAANETAASGRLQDEKVAEATQPGAANAQPRSLTEADARLAADAAALPQLDPADVVRGVQKNLTARGYEPGQSDGIPGLVTRAAVMAYEFDNGLAMTAEPSREIMKHMLIGASAQPAGGRRVPEVRGTQATAIVRWVARQLSGLGYKAGPGDGAMGADLVEAIRAYEAAQKLPVTGRVSAPLVARLMKPPVDKKASIVQPSQTVARAAPAKSPGPMPAKALPAEPVAEPDAVVASGPPVPMQ